MWWLRMEAMGVLGIPTLVDFGVAMDGAMGAKMAHNLADDAEVNGNRAGQGKGEMARVKGELGSKGAWDDWS
ncbi:hypothetical protein SLA2020_523710 [Shorea laevis]